MEMLQEFIGNGSFQEMCDLPDLHIYHHQALILEIFFYIQLYKNNPVT
jgi:hypothetical protein